MLRNGVEGKEQNQLQKSDTKMSLQHTNTACFESFLLKTCKNFTAKQRLVEVCACYYSVVARSANIVSMHPCKAGISSEK